MWDYLGGFDFGKANPTAALVACVDHDGVIYVLREYYAPGMTPKQHKEYLDRFDDFRAGPMYADPSMFFPTQAQADGTFKALSAMFAEEGIYLAQAPERHELLGMERILAHWHNLDEREPTLKIVCPKQFQDLAKPDYRVWNSGCPNLLWELRRARREELTATQLQNKNPSEKIVDKDNHLRDCLKYLVLTLPEPAQKSLNQIIQERVRPLVEARDLTSATIRALQIKAEFEQAAKPIRLGRYRRS